MATATLQRAVVLEITECINCGTSFALPKSLHDHCYNHGGFFYCPAGHRQGWTEANSKMANEQLKEENARLQSSLNYKDQQIESERRQKIEVKKTLTRERNRAKNGVCPCCNRSFVQLARHMKTKHPEFASE